MTIGIAAFGPRAGLAIIEGLKAAEAVGRGALHGFISFVGIGEEGQLHRAETQDGGVAALLAGEPLPASLAGATRAGLMSSGPNRPSPLSQFTPADPAAGLVAGHRFPNMPGADGTPLNLDVLALMRRGESPERALSAVVARNPSADAGFIALSHDGRLFVRNTLYLSSFGDAGQAIATVPGGGGGVAVLHNAIQPHRSLAALVTDVALSVLAAQELSEFTIDMAAGVPLRLGPANALEIDGEGHVVAVEISDPRYLAGSWSMGTGYRTAVRRYGVALGHAMYEPYLNVSDGTIAMIDGRASLRLRVRIEEIGLL